MKLYKLSSILALFALLAIILVSCKEDTVNPAPISVTKPTPPTSIQATSIDASTVLIKWVHSTDVGKTGFAYDLVVTPGATAPVTIDKAKNTYQVSNLVEGTEYTFTLKSKLNDTLFSETSAVVKWSPAGRFNKNVNDATIKIYETASGFGSGLIIYDAESTPAGPNTVTKSNSAKWNFALYTTGSVLYIGAPTKVGYDYASGTEPGITQLAQPVENITSLDDVVDNVALDTKQYLEAYYDLAEFNSTLCFIVRYHELATTSWNYAKILVKYVNNSYLQGTAPNRYIECIVSHQKKADVPYAKIDKK